MVGVVLFVVTLQSLQRVSMSDTSQIISREYAKQKKKSQAPNSWATGSKMNISILAELFNRNV